MLDDVDGLGELDGVDDPDVLEPDEVELDPESDDDEDDDEEEEDGSEATEELFAPERLSVR